MPSPRAVHVTSAVLAFVVGLGAVLIAGGGDDEVAASLTLHDPDATAGFRKVEDVRPAMERVVRVDVPYTYAGAERVSYVVALLVAEDASFAYPVGAATSEFDVSPDESEGVASLTARVRGSGRLYWALSASPIGGEGPSPASLEGTVVLREAER